jgi:hypothetical protein
MNIHRRKRIGLRSKSPERVGTTRSRNSDNLINPSVIGFKILIGKGPIGQF